MIIETPDHINTKSKRSAIVLLNQSIIGNFKILGLL